MRIGDTEERVTSESLRGRGPSYSGGYDPNALLNTASQPSQSDKEKPSGPLSSLLSSLEKTKVPDHAGSDSTVMSATTAVSDPLAPQPPPNRNASATAHQQSSKITEVVIQVPYASNSAAGTPMPLPAAPIQNPNASTAGMITPERCFTIILTVPTVSKNLLLSATSQTNQSDAKMSNTPFASLPSGATKTKDQGNLGSRSAVTTMQTPVSKSSAQQPRGAWPSQKPSAQASNVQQPGKFPVHPVCCCYTTEFAEDR